jgi:uncharacterized protein YdhG (YjbR/CyaY superfamily)
MLVGARVASMRAGYQNQNSPQQGFGPSKSKIFNPIQDKELLMSTKNESQKTAESTDANNQASQGFTNDEKAAMRERAKELKAEARASKNKAEGENAALAAIAAMPEPDRSMAARLHEIIKANAPTLSPKTWYGMPAYADKDGNVICFFQNASKFNARYATLGFNDKAHLDEGMMWPTSFALKELNAAEEARIAALVKKAVS